MWPTKHLYSPACEIVPLSSSIVVEVGLSSEMLFIGQASPNATGDSGVPTVMGRTERCMRGCSLPSLTSTIFTDTATINWEASKEKWKIQALWSKQEVSLHIGILELQVVDNACQAFQAQVKGTAVHILTNNITTVYYANKQGGAHSNQLYKEAITFCHFCIK